MSARPSYAPFCARWSAGQWPPRRGQAACRRPRRARMPRGAAGQRVGPGNRPGVDAPLQSAADHPAAEHGGLGRGHLRGPPLPDQPEPDALAWRSARGPSNARPAAAKSVCSRSRPSPGSSRSSWGIAANSARRWPRPPTTRPVGNVAGGGVGRDGRDLPPAPGGRLPPAEAGHRPAAGRLQRATGPIAAAAGGGEPGGPAEVVLAEVESQAAAQQLETARQEYAAALAELRQQFAAPQAAVRIEPAGGAAAPRGPPAHERRTNWCNWRWRAGRSSPAAQAQVENSRAALCPGPRRPHPRALVGPAYEHERNGRELLRRGGDHAHPAVERGRPRWFASGRRNTVAIAWPWNRPGSK